MFFLFLVTYILAGISIGIAQEDYLIKQYGESEATFIRFVLIVFWPVYAILCILQKLFGY